MTNCADEPQLQEPILNPSQFQWHEVSKIQHYWLQVDAMTKPMGIWRSDGRTRYQNDQCG